MSNGKPALGEQATNAKLLLSNLTIIFRQVRNGEHDFTVNGMKVFEDGLVHLGCEIEDIFSQLGELVDENVAALEQAAALLRKVAAMVDRLDPADAIKIGELVEAAKPPVQKGPVYQPEENRSKSFLRDMAKPTLGNGSLKPLGDNVVLFTGVRHERREEVPL